MNQLLSKSFPAENTVSNLPCQTEIQNRNCVFAGSFWYTQDGEKGWGSEFPPAFFSKSFTCLAKAARLLSRPIPLLISFLRGDGLVGKGTLVARQVKHSFDAGGNGL